ncbi:(Fe-S)-binding protein [Infirmifilum lucidum]|uniref:(Fe-S)-binding protein n=1 Tax=Infirmifilum lucidum TaxID=2776706 RepID=A0A7L9FEM6_9CREN|nr:(Fe-S)-binding protein [Infirmifilum lucidum]QOJ78071.1 (Fe-S)-binding protein [Infirmifilum lucidum]
MSWEEFKPESFKSAETYTLKHLDAVMLHFFEDCVNCGLCEVNCPYTAAGEEYGPVEKAEPLRRIYRPHAQILPKLFPWLFGANSPKSKEELDKWVEKAYRCTNCGLCYVTCPFGIHSGEMIKVLRSYLARTGRIPTLLKMMIDTEASNTLLENEGLRKVWEGMIDRIKAEGVEFNKKNTKYLYLTSLAEVMMTPGSVLGAVKFFKKLNLDWTMPDKPLSMRAPIGSLAGDDEATTIVARRIHEYIKEINPEYVVLSDGGYPYTFFRFDLPRIVGEKPSYKVIHIVELVGEALREGRLKFKNAEEKVTWHSPCKMGRIGGLIDEPVEVLSKVSSNLVKLKSHGVFSKCCGGGGSIACIVPPTQQVMEKVMGVSIPITGSEKVFLDKLYRDMLVAGKAKVDEIRESGASTVVTACIGCFHTMGMTTQAFGVNVKLKMLSEFLAENLE